MPFTQLINRLGKNDARLISRDSFLTFMLVYAAIIAFVLRFGLPWLNQYFIDQGVMPGDRISISLADIYPMIVAYMGIYVGCVLIGSVFGFLLLDEKDQNTLRAMLVSPVPVEQYLLYRIGIPSFLAFFVIIFMWQIINQALLPIWQVLLISAAGALAAPIIALFFATYAENKVQGFAYSKFVGTSGLVFLIGYFVAEPWQWLFGLFPPFWVGKAYWMALEGRPGWIVALVIGVLLQLLLIRFLAQQFKRMAR